MRAMSLKLARGKKKIKNVNHDKRPKASRTANAACEATPGSNLLRKRSSDLDYLTIADLNP